MTSIACGFNIAGSERRNACFKSVNRSIYTAQETAKDDLISRSHLRTKVENWWKQHGWGNPPLPSSPEPIGLFAMQVSSFSFEDAAFATACEDAGLLPVWQEFTADKLSSKSAYKLRLVHPIFAQKRGRKGGLLLKKMRLITNIDQVLGQPLNSLRADDGSSIVEFHHRQQDQCWPGATRLDASTWLQSIGMARDYYAAFLAMAIAHAALFEDYHDPGDEDVTQTQIFVTNVVEPAYRKVEELFGVRPIIVRLPGIRNIVCAQKCLIGDH